MQISNNCILISIQPKWSQLIGNGLKTIEVRKNIPKLKPPFKCYIYCTKNATSLIKDDIAITIDCIAKYGGKIIGEFICTGFKEINTKILCYISNDILDTSCLTADQIRDYANGADMLYGWIIENVKLYEKPKELNKFYQSKVIKASYNAEETSIEKLLNSKRLEVKYFERAPQSWCYCDELSEA